MSDIISTPANLAGASIKGLAKAGIIVLRAPWEIAKIVARRGL